MFNFVPNDYVPAHLESLATDGRRIPSRRVNPYRLSFIIIYDT